MLARLSRGIRRPLNTIIGFSDLIRTAAFGPIDNARYLEYARDIKTAGSEIATLVDELDDLPASRKALRARPADLDLGALLEACVVRVRGQAGNARVLVRSAISERLPRSAPTVPRSVRRCSTSSPARSTRRPPGGSVVLSAQLEDDGTVSVMCATAAATSWRSQRAVRGLPRWRRAEGEALAPVRSSVGLALTRSLLAVNTFSLSVAPTGGTGTLFQLVIPPELVAKS